MGTVIAYNSSLSGLVGGINAAVMMSQLEYWFKVMKGKVFYKFLAPCDHEHYKEGDSWVEELGISISEARNAFRKIGVVYKSKRAFIESKDKFQGKLYASYYDRMRKKTYYYRNDEAVKVLLHQVQSGETNQNKELSKIDKTEDSKLKEREIVKEKNQSNRNEKTAYRLNKDYYKDINTEITAKRDIETDKLISVNEDITINKKIPINNHLGEKEENGEINSYSTAQLNNWVKEIDEESSKIIHCSINQFEEINKNADKSEEASKDNNGAVENAGNQLDNSIRSKNKNNGAAADIMTSQYDGKNASYAQRRESSEVNVKLMEKCLNQSRADTYDEVSNDYTCNDILNYKIYNDRHDNTISSEVYDGILVSDMHDDNLSSGAYDGILISDRHHNTISSDTYSESLCDERYDKSSNKVDYTLICQLYNEHLGVLLGIKETLTDKEQQLAGELFSRGELTLENLGQAMKKVADSRFLCGKTTKSTWRASLAWLLKKENFDKVMAGNYDEPEWTASCGQATTDDVSPCCQSSYREYSQPVAAVSGKVSRFNQMESHSWDFDEIEELEMRLIDQRIKEMNQQGTGLSR